jgi:hypothetical protein
MDLTEFEYINGYDNLYKINKNGDVYSCRYSKLMSPNITEDDYYFVMLTKEGICKKCRIHRLIAKQWISNPDNLPEVDHIDRNRQNNHIDNLRWVDRQTNRRNQDRYDNNQKPEVIEKKIDELKEYKRLWAEKNRREKGCKLKLEMTKTQDPEYQKIKTREYRERLASKLTEEEKEARLKARREAYAKKPQTEEQKEKARERARLQRERKRLGSTTQ